MRITYIYDENGPNWEGVEWRCINFMHAINRNGRHKASLLCLDEFINKTDEAKNRCAHSDILILHRNIWGKALSSIQHWMAQDKVVIADFDEAFQLLSPPDPEYQIFEDHEEMNGSYGKALSSSRLAQFKWGLQIIGTATVPSPLLAEDWMAYGQIEIIKDYLELDKFESFRPQQHNTLNLGWKCKSSQLRSPAARGILEAIREVMMRRQNVGLVICCPEEPTISDLGFPMDRVYSFLADSGKGWLESLAWIDVGIAPLLTDFDQRVSWRTLLEYMALKIPWIASQGPAFHDLRPYGRLLENKAELWQPMLLDMVDNYQSIQAEASEAPYLFSLGQTIDENIHNVIGIYAKILNNLQDGIIPNSVK